MAAVAARPRFPRSRPSMASAALMASAAWRVVLVQALAASLWPPRVLALERAVVSSLPREPARPLAVALTPPALAQPLVDVLTPREPPRVLAFVPRALGLQLGPCLSALLARGIGARIYCMALR